jgi:hypothetical protein
MWSSRSHTDGSWHAVVEYKFGLREDAPVVMADAARHSAVLERDSASPTSGLGGTFSRSLQRALERRGLPEQNRQAWRDAHRWEHNYVRPHEALHMRTPASVWHPSPRRCDPQPPRWEYTEAAWVLKLDCQGKLETGKKVEGKSLLSRRVSAGDKGGAAHDGLLLQHSHSRIRSRNTALDDRRALHSDSQFLSSSVKDV